MKDERNSPSALVILKPQNKMMFNAPGELPGAEQK